MERWLDIVDFVIGHAQGPTDFQYFPEAFVKKAVKLFFYPPCHSSCLASIQQGSYEIWLVMVCQWKLQFDGKNKYSPNIPLVLACLSSVDICNMESEPVILSIATLLVLIINLTGHLPFFTLVEKKKSTITPLLHCNVVYLEQTIPSVAVYFATAA